jgi:hypothetical protein
MAVTMKNGVLWDITHVSEERSSSTIRVTRIGEVGTLAVTSNRRMPRRNTMWEQKRSHIVFFTVCVSYYLLLTLFLVHRFLSPWWWRWYIRPKHQFLQEPHGITSEKMLFFMRWLDHGEKFWLKSNLPRDNFSDLDIHGWNIYWWTLKPLGSETAKLHWTLSV